MKEMHMIAPMSYRIARPMLFALSVLFALCASAVFARAQQTALPASQQLFATPQEAAEALIEAAEKFDIPVLKQLFGPGGNDLVITSDTIQDKNRATEFAAKAREKARVTIDPKNPRRATLSVGMDNWPFPVPIVDRGGKWFFDSKAGRREILDRRIGANELDAIAICRGYVDAQKEYASDLHDNSTVHQYAQRIISTPGKQDGLVWRKADGTLEGPISDGIAKILEQGYSSRSEPYHGYFFKVLKGQGSAAPLGELNFIIEGSMIGGFALVAAPAKYRVTGVETFIVSHDGIVYQKDFGPETLKAFNEMQLYNPDKTWRRTDDEWPVAAIASAE